MNNYSVLSFVNVKYLRSHVKMTQNDHYLIKKSICYRYKINQMAWFNSKPPGNFILVLLQYGQTLTLILELLIAKIITEGNVQQTWHHLNANGIYQDGSSVCVDEVFIISDEQISENSSFVKISQTDHVLHTLDWGWVHRLDASFGSKPLLFSIIIHHLWKFLMWKF